MGSEFILSVRMFETSLTEIGEDPTNNCMRLSELRVTQWLFFLIVNAYGFVWYFPSLAFLCTPRIVLPEMTGRRILPLLSIQTPPSLSGCPATLSSSRQSQGCSLHCSCLFCVGFWLHSGRFSQFSSTVYGS